MSLFHRLVGPLTLIAGATWAGCGSSVKGNCDPCGDNYVVNADIWGSPDGQMFIAGYRGFQGLLRRFDQGTWVPIYEGGGALMSMWGTSSEDFFLVDVQATVLHYDHGTWQTWALNSGADGGLTIGQAFALWGTANDDVFVAGAGGAILHFDGVAWLPMSTPTRARIKGLWGSSHDNVIAVGDEGTILRFNSGHWYLLPSPTTAQLNAVWGAAADNVLIVGEVIPEVSHVILRFDGQAVSVVHEGDKALLGIPGSAADRSYAVGARRNDSSISGGVFRYDGATWTEQSVHVGQFLWDVWVDPDGSYTLVGPEDTIVNMTAN